jgi:hypothetical protein
MTNQSAGTSSLTDRVSTGLEGLDEVLDSLRIGDNVVWRVSDLADYRRFVTPFIESATAAGRQVIYLRFGQHPPLVADNPAVNTIVIDALGGFEAFTSAVWQLIETHGRGAFYICDCLSDLLNAWATDAMVGNFFRVVCPLLFQLDTVAWFALHPQRHSRATLNKIRRTTQVMIDVYRHGDNVQIHPVKAWRRQSPTMFLPHREHDGRFTPVTDSSDATRLQASLEQKRSNTRQPLLDHWDRLFQQAGEALAQNDSAAIARYHDLILPLLISREERMLALAHNYLKLADVLNIRRRMVGTGFIGGKATGMLIARAILQKDAPALGNHCLEPHDSSYLATDAYYGFLVHNGLWPAIMRQRSAAGYLTEAEALRDGILAGEFPPETLSELERLLDHYGQYPILVRSSSLQEDSFGNAFAGKYESVFVVNQGPPEDRLAALENAIRTVYASSMSHDALVYRQQRGLDQLEEPMALLIQRVNGRFHGQYYLPDAAAVGVSRNTFAWDSDMDPKAGMVRLVMGLGTRAVDRIEGDHACVMALDFPTRQPFRNPGESYQFSQHLVDVLDLHSGELATRPLSLLTEKIPDLPMAHLAEIDREASERARELKLAEPVWRLTFRPLVRNSGFVPRLTKLLKTLENAYQHPVDVEFTLHLNSHGEPAINLVQCRPLATLGETGAVTIPENLDRKHTLFRTQGHFMGGNIKLPIHRIIRVDAARYSVLTISQRHDLARLVGTLVRETPDNQKVMLIGPGRWGTSSPELGVPVRFADIARVAVLVEVAEMSGDMVPDLSYGSHFFQDLVETGIAYVALFPQHSQCSYQPDWLDSNTQPLSIPAEAPLSGCLRWYDSANTPLQLAGDLLSQILVCYRQE